MQSELTEIIVRLQELRHQYSENLEGLCLRDASTRARGFSNSNSTDRSHCPPRSSRDVSEGTPHVLDRLLIETEKRVLAERKIESMEEIACQFIAASIISDLVCASCGAGFSSPIQRRVHSLQCSTGRVQESLTPDLAKVKEFDRKGRATGDAHTAIALVPTHLQFGSCEQREAEFFTAEGAFGRQSAQTQSTLAEASVGHIPCQM